ncbi:MULTISPECIES: polysaccharide biosynthesis tyrosine autokinase [unclassified Phyllobacterium]|uniref:GumC family protein n=1 Tax=unclassified Phyllobacterium TaxID=2638441 RepID=UPI00068C3FBF|nr:MULTISPECIES: polysaccharide biosynthesis tyrosine autokinase [unclassified Phyllobacterium]SFI66066.1 capsular exopolysaccharide family [Phyllobacterium sp. CL33Tsu]
MIVSEVPSTHGSGMALPRIASLLWRRKLVVLAGVATAVGVALVGYMLTPAQYSSEAILALNVRKLQALPTESVVSPLPQESPVLRTELDIITSRTMAENVLARLDREGFNANGRLVPEAERAASRVEPPVPDSANAATLEDQNRDRIDRLLSDVNVANDGRSYTIYISYRSDNPVYSAAVANAFGEAYLDYQVDVQTSATRRVGDWLGGKIVSLRATLEQSERAAADFREKSGLVKANGMTLQSQQIAALNGELANLRAKLAGTEARLATAIDAANNKAGVALTEVLNSPAILALRTEQSRVERAILEIKQSGATQSAQLPQLNSQLDSLNVQINEGIQQIINSLRSEIEVTHRQQAAVEANLKEIQDSMSTANQALVHADQLDREAAANRAIYESYLTRYKQTIEQDGIASADARMISRAQPASSKSSPRLKSWLLLGIIAGTGLGFLGAFLIEWFDRSIRSPESLETITRLPIIGRIPELTHRERQEVARMVRDGHSSFGRAIADLQAHLLLSSSPKASRAIAITSAGDQEGKTLIVAGLARSLSATGIRTVVVDANFRNPMVAQEFGDQFGPYLEEVIRGRQTLEAAVQHDLASTIDFVASQSCEVPAEYLLGHEQFAKMIAQLKRQYDIVLIDTPALNNGADAIRVSALVDTTIVVVRRDTARTDMVVAAVNRLRADGRKISGIVLNSDRRKGKAGHIDTSLPKIKLASPQVIKKIAGHVKKSRSFTAKA